MSCGSGEKFAFESPADAVRALIAQLEPVGVERVQLANAAGRVLACDICADRPSPAADVSAMDGFAVRAGDLTGDIPIEGEVRIGREPPTLSPGHARRIVTGACIPRGCDAVLRVEDAQVHGGRLSATTQVRAGDNIRRCAENIESGACVIRGGVPVTPGVAGALACFGVASPEVHARVRLGILVTGDEVRPATDQCLSPWQLRDSNGHALAAMFAHAPWIDARSPCHSVDDAPTIRATAHELLATCDAVLLTGGVSMGTRDFVPGVLRDLGARVLFHKLPQRPGKPVLGAIMPGGKLALALPGNPVSVMVTARRIAAPVLWHLGGLRSPPPDATIVLADPPGDAAPIWRFVPVAIDELGRGVIVRGRGSGDVVHAARAAGFVEIPPHSPPASRYTYYPWSI